MSKLTDLQDRNGGYWGEHKDFPVKDWQYEVANGYTREGYWEWVEHKLHDRGDHEEAG